MKKRYWMIGKTVGEAKEFMRQLEPDIAEMTVPFGLRNWDRVYENEDLVGGWITDEVRFMEDVGWLHHSLSELAEQRRDEFFQRQIDRMESL